MNFIGKTTFEEYNTVLVESLQNENKICIFFACNNLTKEPSKIQEYLLRDLYRKILRRTDGRRYVYV
uniref:Uncharacterized protein n=1 Tax=Rhizophora mucronata TaxID=61149 RepID=A0A2P2JN95_RHIMU